MASGFSSARPAVQAWVFIGILLIAANLRAPITGVAPVLDLLRSHFSLSASAAGFLTTLPLFAFALMSPVAAQLGQRWGLARILGYALVVLVGALLLRVSGSVAALFVATLLIGFAIAVGNVLLPALVKQNFPKRVTTVTAAYALTMGIAAGITSAAAIPLSQLSQTGWDIALIAPLAVAVLALVTWLPQWRKHSCQQGRQQERGAPPQPTQQPAISQPLARPVWRYALAWQVTFFFGLNSFVYYIVISWLPAMLQPHGFSPARIGELHGLLQIASATPGLVLIPLLRQRQDLRAAAMCVTLLALAGLLGLMLLPGWSLLWCLTYGFGTGASIILALAFVGLRSASVGTATALSGMTQGLGYLLAATGPALAGAIHDWLGSWSAVLALCVGCVVVQVFLGVRAGAARRLGDV
ncbi:MFS transporter [Alcanivorax quisquiliarum]|uniref:MFS transporter n=1 Tax=Alcanivorax quisquiliarum TaxID=2933565 RepID=A0ABT0E7I6_9GAMM|nr:MFS transporter [Alcanivorax quisquiliarum]MCK0537803.1 MFS transporter [Alcanivorax quisquiliarum]